MLLLQELLILLNLHQLLELLLLLKLSLKLLLMLLLQELLILLNLHQLLPFLFFSIDPDSGSGVSGMSGRSVNLNLILLAINNNSNLLSGSNLLGGDNNSLVLGAVLEDNVLTVVHFIHIFLLVKGGNLSRLNGAPGRRVVLGKLLQDSSGKGFLGTEGKESLGHGSKSDV